jgi:hypothetical protein
MEQITAVAVDLAKDVIVGSGASRDISVVRSVVAPARSYASAIAQVKSNRGSAKD